MFLWKIYAPMIMAFLFVISIFPNGFVALAYAQGVTAELDYTVGADEVVDFVEPGDIFRANITVHGFEYESTAVVPFDVMLAIDMSGSMSYNDEDNRRLDAAELFLQMCNGASPTIAGPIRAGMVGFRKEGRLEEGLTDNYAVYFGDDGVIVEMRNQHLGVATNIADAMAKAQQELDTNSVNNTRAVVLLTDGWPDPGPEGEAPTLAEQQSIIDEQLIPDARTKGIRYYTISLGSNPYVHLSDIAEATGGFYRPAATATALAQIFTEIFAHVSKTMTANQVTLHVQRDTGITRFASGSLEVPPGISDPDNSQLDAFADQNQGWIDIRIGQLGDGDNATLSFELEALECIPIDDPQDEIQITPVRHPNSVVTYLWGTQEVTYTLDEKSISCKKKPTFEIKKEFIPKTSRIEVTLTNNYTHRPDIPDAERTFTNIRVFEKLGPYFVHPYYGPPRFYGLGTVMLDPIFVPVRRFIPAPSSNKGGEFLYWKIPTLGPEESKKISFRVGLTAWAPSHAGKLLPVDQVDPKVIAPPAPVEHIESKVYYDFGNQTLSKVIPDEWFLPVMLPDLSSEGGRPDLYIEPSLNYYEFAYLPPEPADLSADPAIPATGPWPLTSNLFERSESIDIWIDSLTNGYVVDWSHKYGIDNYLENDVFDPYEDRFKRVTGQGDLFKISSGNRICFKVHNKGAVESDVEAKAFVLRNFPSSPAPLRPLWDTLGDAVTVFSPSWGDYRLLCVEIPPGAIQRGRHTRSFGIWDGMEYDTATIMIQVAPAPNEAHTSNNTSTEQFLVVP